MRKDDVVVLVPGLLGFGELQVGPEKVSYFKKVSQRLAIHTGRSEACFKPFSIPPTAPLCKRATALLAHLDWLRTQPHPSGGPINKIHLIGHSTGGCDIRLLLNTKYTWAGHKPNAEVLERVRQRVGHAIALSAPLQGTPIARRLNDGFTAALPLLWSAAIFSRLGREVEQIYAAAELSALATLNGIAPGTSLARYLSIIPKSDAKTAVEPYLNQILADNDLIDDLTATRMKALNGELDKGDSKPLKCYVSVSPAPGPISLFNFLEAQQTLIYRFAWGKTQSGGLPIERGKFPHAPWIVPAAHSVHSDLDSDGVVPAWSQTVTGQAAGIIEGDHLDVVGHFESGALFSDAVLKSNAGFNDQRFDQLWAKIAADLAQPA